MKASEIEVGKVYEMMVSNKLVPVKVISIDDRPTFRTDYGIIRKAGTTYHCVNQRTGRECRARSAAKFRREIKNETPVQQGPTDAPK